MSRFPIIEFEEIPSIHLYMDQVTTFIDTKLAPLKRRPEDKLLTKTMINNYAKAGLFPSPVKKQYTPNHMMLLILIYHLKSVLSLADVAQLLAPVCAKLKANPASPAAKKLYLSFVAMQKGEEIDSSDPVLAVLRLALEAAEKKRLAEQLIDSMTKPE